MKAHADDRQKIDDLLVLLSQIEAEVNLLKRRIALLEEEIARIKRENQQLMGELQRARTVGVSHLLCKSGYIWLFEL